MNLPRLFCLTSDRINISHSQQVLEFCKAGVRFIQLRCKELSMKEFLREAQMSVEICQYFEARLIINDSVEVANKVEADGVHLGLNDMHISRARDLLGETKLIGYTIHSYQEITPNIIENANYIGMGPFRESKTKTDLSSVLSENDYQLMIQRFDPTPVYIIGGIDIDDISLSEKLGNHGIAVCSCLSKGRNLDIRKIQKIVSEFQNNNLMTALNC